MAPSKRPLSDRLFALLLRLFPREFRGDFGDQMADDFREQRDDAAVTGRWTQLVRVWVDTVIGMIRQAPREHIAQLRRDGAYGIRLIQRNPRFSTSAIVTLALGIGATAAIYSVLYGILLRPLPVSDEDTLAIVYATTAGVRDDAPISFPRFQGWRSSGAFADVAAIRPARFDLAGTREAERVDGARVSANFFTVLGVHAALGRVFTDRDLTGSETPAVISDPLWRRRFGGDVNTIGRTMTLGDRTVTIVGVMPPRFDRWRQAAQIWVPLELTESPSILGARGYRIVTPVGRLRPGVQMPPTRATLEAAGSEPDSSGSSGGESGVRLVRLRDDVVSPRLRRLLVLLFAAVVLTWLVVCANTSMLLMARSAGRRSEMAVRAALGADRSRLLRQLLVESLVLAVPGGIAGALLAAWAVRTCAAFAPPGLFDATAVMFDAPIVAFAFAVTVASAAVFGMVPALSLSKGPALSLSKRPKRLPSLLITAEIAIALLVLVSASLLVKSLVRIQQVPLGFQPDGVLTFRVSLPDRKYDGPHVVEAERELLARLHSLPGVDAVTIGSAIFLPAADDRTSISFDDGRRLTNGNPKDRALAPVLHFAGPNYMRVHGVRLMAGRDLDERDNLTSPPVVLVNEAMATLHWRGQNAIGKRVNFGYRRRGGAFDEPWAEVVGIVADVRHGGVDMPVRPDIYRAELQYVHRELDVMMRTSVPPEDLAAQARAQVRALDPDIATFAARPLAEIVSDATATARYSSALLSLFAGITAVLCGVGVFSVLAYSVTSRDRELGIRLALGAEPRLMVMDVLREACLFVIGGLALGLASAALATRLLAGLLYEVSPRDPAVMIGAAVTIVIIALGAAYIPARRAANVDPVLALRAE